MQQTNGPHALRVAGRYAKDMMLGLLFAAVEAAAAWLETKHPWITPLIDAAINETVTEYHARQRKEDGRE